MAGMKFGGLTAADIAAIVAAINDTWEAVNDTVTFPVGGIVTSPGSVLYTATAKLEIIRGFVVQGSGLVAVGSTNLSFGVKNTTTSANASLIAAAPIARLNSAVLLGDGTETGLATIVGGAGFLVLAQANALFAGSASRSLRVFTDAGTCSGDLSFAFEKHVIIP